MGAAVGLVEVQAEAACRLHTAGLGPAGNLGTVQDHPERALEDKPKIIKVSTALVR